MCNKKLVKMAKSREKIDFMLNELEFIHLSIILYIMLKYMVHTGQSGFVVLYSVQGTH